VLPMLILPKTFINGDALQKLLISSFGVVLQFYLASTQMGLEQFYRLILLFRLHLLVVYYFLD
jgi:hypothetical protein